MVWSARKEQRHVPRKQASRQALDANPVAKKRNAKWALREPRSRLSGRGLNKYRFDVSRRGGVSFLAKRNDAPDYTSRSRTCVRCRALLRESRSISRQRWRRRLFSIYAYVQIFFPLDSRTKGEGRKDESLTRFEALENEGRFRFTCSYSRHSWNK